MKIHSLIVSSLLLLAFSSSLSACTTKDLVPPVSIDEASQEITPTTVEQKADTSDQQLLDELMSDDDSFDADLKNLELELSQ